MHEAGRLFHTLLRRGTDFSRRFALLVVALALLLAGAAGAYFVRNFSVSTQTEDMLSPELPFRQRAQELSQQFPERANNILIVVEGRTPDLADRAAWALAANLRLKSWRFPYVLYLEGHPFFARNGLLFLGTERLYDLSDRLAEAQPFIGGLWRDPSLRGLYAMLELVATEAAGNDAALQIVPIFDAIADVAEAQALGQPMQLSWQQVMRGDGEAERVRRFVVVQPALDGDGLRPARAAIEAIRSTAADLNLDAEHGVTVRLTGPVALSFDELGSVQLGMGIAGVVSLTAVVVLLVACFRSPRQTLACLLTLIIGLVWTGAFAVATVGSLNLISVAFAVLFIGLGVDFGIHYALRYRECREHLPDHAHGLRDAAASVGPALALTAVAAAIGFYAFLPTPYLGLAELGLIAGSGMVIALLATFFVLPALITLIEPRFRRPVPWGGTHRAALAGWLRGKAHWVVAVGGLLALLGVALTPLARFDFDPLRLKDPDSESVATLLDIIADDPGLAYAVTVLVDDVAAAAELAEQAEALPEVDSTRTILSFVPSDQAEKLAVIDDLALFLEPSLTAEQEPAPTMTEIFEAYAGLNDALRDLALGNGAALIRAAGRLDVALDAPMRASVLNPDVLEDLRLRLLGGLPAEIMALRESLRAEPVTLESLPEALRRLWLAPDGRARVEIYPRDTLHEDPAAIGRFVAAVRTIAPEASGPPVTIYEAGRTVVRSFIVAGVIAAVAISVLLLVLLRSVTYTAVVFVPLLLAGLLTIGITVLIGLPFNFANVIVLPLLFGLGVAGSLHFVLRDRHGGSETGALSTSTPRAVTFSALTTMASFGSLVLSEHPGTASMGLLLTIAITATLISTLVVLPAVLTLLRPMLHPTKAVASGHVP
ncbi:MAG: hypothetical protein EA405_02795 [Rhodospirillales bacterium]|nr:MAG: hypothetical protein EA405_02795 [Rhodospirillales bacterium]